MSRVSPPGQTRCCVCGGIASGTHDPATGKWYCLAPECIARTPPKLGTGPVRVGESPRALAGVMGGIRAITGKAPDGERVPIGGEPWHWAPRGEQAVMCKGAVFPSTNEAAHLIHGISDAAAQRAILRDALAEVGGEVARLPPDLLAVALAMTERQVRRQREKMGRRKRAA